MPLWIQEYDSCGFQGNNHLPIANEHGGGLKTQSVANGGTSTQSGPFEATTVIIGIQADANVWVDIGANPTASVGGRIFIPSGQLPFYVGVSPGKSHRLAVINAS